MSTPGKDSPAKEPGRGIRGGQRFGHVTGRASSAGSYLVRDDETGITYTFDYADIVTEGLRVIRPEERVRFLIDDTHSGYARYVIRLDLPDIGELYT